MSSEEKLTEFFAEWEIPQSLLKQLAPLQEATESLDLFHPVSAVPYSGEYKTWSSLLKYGLLPIGNCPNADFIAVDWRTRVGSVFYISHDEFDTTGETEHNMSEISICVAESVQEFINGIQSDSVPLDYYEATEKKF